MPYKGHRSVTITEEAQEQLKVIKEIMRLKSESATLNEIIKDKYSEVKP